VSLNIQPATRRSTVVNCHLNVGGIHVQLRLNVQHFKLVCTHTTTSATRSPVDVWQSSSMDGVQSPVGSVGSTHSRLHRPVVCAEIRVDRRHRRANITSRTQTPIVHQPQLHSYRVRAVHSVRVRSVSGARVVRSHCTNAQCKSNTAVWTAHQSLRTG
jgi:hypothetical protein